MLKNADAKNVRKRARRPRDWRKITSVFVLSSFVIAAIYVVVVLILAPAQAEMIGERTKGDYVLMLLQCLLGIAAIVLPSMLQRRLNFTVPSYMIIFYTLFLYGAIFLGEVRAFYYRVPHWDTFLHTMSGAGLGALSYSLIAFLNKSDGVPVHMSPLFVAVTAFCFAMTLGVLWEMYEFGMDVFVGTNMQKFALDGGVDKVGQAALMDTMKDLIVDAIGSLVMSVAGYLSLKYKTGFVEKLMVRMHK